MTISQIIVPQAPELSGLTVKKMGFSTARLPQAFPGLTASPRGSVFFILVMLWNY